VGIRLKNGLFNGIGGYGYWWSATEGSTDHAWYRCMGYDNSSLDRDSYFSKEVGFSVRLVRPATSFEQDLADGTIIPNAYTGNNGRIYSAVKIGTQVWLSENLAETKYYDGTWIPGYDDGEYTPISNTDWSNLTTGALCAYDNDLSNVYL